MDDTGLCFVCYTPAEMSARQLRFDLYSIHAHLESGAVDYGELFRQVAEAMAGYKDTEAARRIAITRSDILPDGKVFIVAYTGYSDRSTLYFDLASNVPQTEKGSPTKFRARKTHILIAPERRLMLIESKKGNLTASDLEIIIESLGRGCDHRYRKLELSLNPVADVDFSREIDSLKRIQSAVIVIGEPNFNWTEWNNTLATVAEDSNARSLGVMASAKREKSLSKESGVIQFVKEFAGQAKSIFKRVTIVGSRSEDAGLTTLNLSRYIEHYDVTVPQDPVTEQPIEEDVQKQLEAYINARPAA